LDFEDETKFDLSIIDILGRNHIERNDLASRSIQTISLSQLPAGSYFINIRTSNGFATKKILVTK